MVVLGGVLYFGVLPSLTTFPALLALLTAQFGAQLRGPNVEFEMLRGLAPELLDSLHNQGYRTREYAIFGGEWWLYVLNRIAEQPERAITALADLQLPAGA